MKAKAYLSLSFQTERQVVALIDALKPEVEKQVGTRSKVDLSINGLCLVFSVEAEDTVALRAALNAYLRWVNSASMVLNALGKQE